MDEVWRVRVEDLSSLGGPMGTENVHTIESRLFATREVADKWIRKHYKKTYGREFKFKWGKRSGENRWYIDTGGIHGYELSKTKVHDA